MNTDVYSAKDEYDDDELSPEIRSHLERLERDPRLKMDKQVRLRRQKLKVRRQIEAWAEARQLREDIDYIH